MPNIASRPCENLKSTMAGKPSAIKAGVRFYVYVLGNETNGKLAVSMTQDLQTRVRNQKNDLHPRDFTSVHAIHSLLHVEEFSDLCEALARYEHLRGLDADKLSWLIGEENPEWHDLFHIYVGETVQSQL